MMKVFSERRSRAFEPASATPPPRNDELSGNDRLAQGFELLFGTHLEQHRHALERVETELTGRLDSLQHESAEQARVLVALTDKASASVEREQDAERRRKNVEAELRQALVELREAVRSSFAELHARADRLEQSLVEHLDAHSESLRAGDDKRHEEALIAFEARLEALEAGRVDRGSLAALLARTARELEDAR
jgi:chromosome segregation ATPase